MAAPPKKATAQAAVSQDEVADFFNKASQAFQTGAKDFTDKFNTEYASHKPEFDNTIKQLNATLVDTFGKIQNLAGPESQATAQDFKAKFDKAVGDFEAYLKTPEVQRKFFFNLFIYLLWNFKILY